MLAGMSTPPWELGDEVVRELVGLAAPECPIEWHPNALEPVFWAYQYLGPPQVRAEIARPGQTGQPPVHEAVPTGPAREGGSIYTPVSPVPMFA